MHQKNIQISLGEHAPRPQGFDTYVESVRWPPHISPSIPQNIIILMATERGREH